MYGFSADYWLSAAKIKLEPELELHTIRFCRACCCNYLDGCKTHPEPQKEEVKV